MTRLLLVPYTFCLLNWAAMKALWCYLRGEGSESLWSAPTSAGRGRALDPSKP